MVKEITRNIYTCLKADSVFKLLQQHPLEGVTAIVLPSDKEVLKKLYRDLASCTNSSPGKFFLVITNNTFEKVNITDIGRFFFLSNYYSPKNNCPLLILHEEISTDKIEKFKEWYTSQGFQHNISLSKDFTDDIAETSNVLSVAQEQLEPFFIVLKNRYIDLKWINQSIILHAADVDMAIQITKRLQLISDMIEKENPDIYNTLLYISQLQENMRSKDNMVEYQEHEIGNLKTFIDLLRESKEVEHILNFYHTQYEVLPLWYKRFGHVIKILMGKRKITFRSNK